MTRSACLLLPLCLTVAACGGPSDTPAPSTPEAATPAAEPAPALPPAAEPAAEPMPDPAPEPTSTPEPTGTSGPAAPGARITLFNATCPGDIAVHADDGGPVYVNGTEASYKSFSESYYEATDAASGVTISVTTNTDGTLSVSYTGKGRAHGVCTLDG